MVAVTRIVADRLLESEVFLAPEEKQPADRGIVVRPLEDRVGADPEIAFQSERVGRVPLGRLHDRLHLGLRADQGHVQRVAGMAVAGHRDAGIVVERRMMPAYLSQAKGMMRYATAR